MVPRNELWLFLEEPPSASKQVNPHNGPTYNCGHLFFFFFHLFISFQFIEM